MKRNLGFSNKSKTAQAESFYDLREDWALIESSLAKQYGIRIRANNDMRWGEFCTLISGLMSDTPLGQIVAIRAEKDSKTIKNFTAEQRKIHTDWKRRQAKKMLDNPEKLEKDMEQLIKSFQMMFG